MVSPRKPNWFVKKETIKISRKMPGENHLATKMAKSLHEFLPFLVYGNNLLPFHGEIGLVSGFDKGNLRHVS